MGKWGPDGDGVGTKAIIERGNVESPHERPLVIKSVEDIKKGNGVENLK
jgi:hypothetical protein